MYIYQPTTNQKAPLQLIGGKAYHLMEMEQAGFNVPKWFVVTAKAYQSSLTEKSTSTTPEFRLSDALTQEIQEHLTDSANENIFFAVRSSAIGEDSLAHSFAGQLESYLYIPTAEVIPNIIKVWSSAFSERVQAYRKHNQLQDKNFSVAVIVQKMIDSEVSGVAFSLDPLTGNRKTVFISSVYGLGEGLVSGLLDADNFKVIPPQNKEETKNTYLSELVSKKQGIFLDNTIGKHTTQKDIPLEKQEEPSLSQEQLQEITQEVKKISALFGRPQDIEWTFASQTLYILQSRPITTLHSLPDQSQTKTIWENSNIIESYSGVTTPLTFSFVKDVYREVYIQFCKTMGVEDSVIEQNDPIFSMVGLIQGRIYYNLLNWYKVLSLLPGYSLNAEFMEQMMGVKEKLTVPPTVIPSEKNPYWRVLILCQKLLSNLIRLPKNIKKFFQLLDQTLSPYDTLDLSEETAEDLMNHYFHLQRSLLQKWQAPLVNDFYAMIFYGLLKKLVAKWKLDPTGNLQNDLLCGEGEIISTAPIEQLRKISNEICQNETLKELFTQEEESEILRKLPEFPAIEQKIHSYIKRFGIRCFNELKLETITPKQNPTIVIRFLKSYTQQGIIHLEQNQKQEQQLRKKAEKQIFQKLRFKLLKKFIFKRILKQARTRIKNRENLRFERTRIFALIRELFLESGKKLYAEDLIDHPRDIFYLSKEELFSFIEGTSFTTNLRKLIALRKEEFEPYQKTSISDRFETYGFVYHANSFQRKTENLTNDSSNNVPENSLQGIGCCPGIVKAPVRLVYDPNEAELEGCIMAAERTDPGWAPLFPIAKAIVVERGSPLSHSAIVAREMGIPAIVGVSNLMTQLKDGELIQMDGATGIIQLFREE